MGKSRANWEGMTAKLTATERLQRALNRPVNEAIKVDEPKKPTEVKAVPTPGLLGDGAAAGAMRALRERRKLADD